MVKATRWVKVNLFLSSYFPLWIILLAIQLFANYNTLVSARLFEATTEYLAENAYALPLIGILTLVSFWPLHITRRYIEETRAKQNHEDLIVKSKEDTTSEYLLYIITYVFPFMTTDSLNALSAIALGGAMVIIAILYIRANLFHVNPTLMLLYNYRLYKIIDTRENTYHLLSKDEALLNGKKVRANSLNGIFYVEKPFQPKDNTTILSP